MSREAVWALRTNLGALEGKKSLAPAWNRFTFPRSPNLYRGHYTGYTVPASYRQNTIIIIIIIIIIIVVVVVLVVTTNVMSTRYSRLPSTP